MRTFHVLVATGNLHGYYGGTLVRGGYATSRAFVLRVHAQDPQDAEARAREAIGNITEDATAAKVFGTSQDAPLFYGAIEIIASTEAIEIDDL